VRLSVSVYLYISSLLSLAAVGLHLLGNLGHDPEDHHDHYLMYKSCMKLTISKEEKFETCFQIIVNMYT